MNHEPISPQEDDDPRGLIDSFNFAAEGAPMGSTPFYNYPQINAMTQEALALAHQEGMTLPRAIKKVAFRHAAQAEMLNQTADGSEFDYSDREICEHLDDLTQFYQQMIGYEMLHTERDYLRRRARSDEAKNRIRDFIREESKNEPLFDAINRAMKTRYRTLPYGEAEAIARAIEAFRQGSFDDEHVAAMADYYERVRRELSAEELGADSTAPVPAVERTGAGIGGAQADWSQLGKLSPREQTRMIARMLNHKY